MVDGVVNGRAAAGARAHDLVAQRPRIAREGLKDLRFVIEGHDKRLVLIVAKHAEKETYGSILFEFDTLAIAVRSVKQHADAQRQIGLLAKIPDFLWLAFVENFEIA